jgi:NADH-quinone oxidoreductase subunit G
MCDDGRLGYHYINANSRFRQPLSLRGGQLAPLPWSEAIVAIRDAFRAAATRDASAVVGVLSPFLTCEEAYLLATFLKGLSGQVRLALGPVPVIGEDDTYPKDRRGRPVQPVKFTIRAEKCPNRKGVEAILRHFQGDLIDFAGVLRAADEGRLHALYIAAGYPPRGVGWISEAQASALERVPLLTVQDLFPSPASNRAQYVVPAVSFAEKDGTFVNHAGLAQAIHWAVSPPAGCRSDGQVFLDLLGRRGLVHAPSLRLELAREVAYFAPLAGLDEAGTPAPHSPDPSGYYAPPGRGGPGDHGVWLEAHA